MTKRGKELTLQHEYEKAIQEAEKKRPQGIRYKIFAENGSQDGILIYDPKEDSITLEIRGVPISIFSGTYIESVNKALSDILSAKDDEQ